MIVALTLTTVCALASAAPTQEEVFGSIREHVTDSNGPSNASGWIFALLFFGAAGIGTLVYLSKREANKTKPLALNHPGKLLKEIAKEVGLKPAEIRQIKALAEDFEQRQGTELLSPLTLLICPSLMSGLPTANRSIAMEESPVRKAA